MSERARSVITRLKQPPIRFRAGDRVFLVGASGTGKTTFGLALLSKLWTHYQVPTWIINSKPDKDLIALGQAKGAWYYQDDPPKPIRKFGVQVWKPRTNDPELYNRFLEQLIDIDVPGILYIDEVLRLKGNKRDYPPNFDTMITQVRSKEITMIYGSQRMAGVPTICLNQATHVIMFNVRDPYDRRVLATEMRLPRDQIAELNPHEHGFHYANLLKIGEPRYYSRYQDFF